MTAAPGSDLATPSSVVAGSRPVVRGETPDGAARHKGKKSDAIGSCLGKIVVPSLGAGVLLALSLPPWGWWPLAFIGAAILYVRLERLPLLQRALSGWAAGLGCFVPGLFWSITFNWYGAIVLIVVEALFFAAAAALVPPSRCRLAGFVAAFVILEALRETWPFGGLPLGGVFLGQAGGPLLPTARLGGPLLLTAEVWLIGSLLGTVASLLYTSRRPAWLSTSRPAESSKTGPPESSKAKLLELGLALTLLIAAILGAAFGPDGGSPRQQVAVAAVQGGGRRGTSAQESKPVGVFKAELRASNRLRRVDLGGETGRSAPSVRRLVVWPEDVVALSRPLRGSPQARMLSQLARRLDATVLAGVTVDVSNSAFLNEAVAWGPDGHIVATYEKVHRVPFGEYVPYRGFFSHLASLGGVPRDAVPGHSTGLMRTPAGPLGVMLSYEVFYATSGQSSVNAGAQLLVVPTNTSSYSTSQVPSQEVAADRVQAVEHGRDLVQAAPTGFSTIVASSGAVLDRSALGQPSVLIGSVALRDGVTVYNDLGNLPTLLIAGFALVSAWVVSLKARRPRPVP